MERSGDLAALLALSQPGDTATIEVWHHGSRRTLKATLDDADGAGTHRAEAAPQPKGRLGLALRAFRPDENGGSGPSQGLLIEAVSGPAARAGVLPGDVLLAVDGQPVNTVAQVSVAAGVVFGV